jgi:all-trans-retinol 13,14-reductase
MTHKPSVIIIGGGIGGLFCGAILSKEGYKVTILEQHYKIGGGLHMFKREGVSFETGIHVVGHFQPGGILNRICAYLGIMDKLSIRDADDDCFELFQIGCDGSSYRYAKGAERFIETLSEYFPEEKENIARYIEAINAICNNSKMCNLEYEAFSMQMYSDDFTQSVGDFINSFTDNERLRSVLAFANPLYAGEQYKTPVYIHALITKMYVESAARFVGGSQQLADALAEIIRQSGGEVHTNCGVKHIEIANQEIDYIVTADGKQRRADRYISAIHPSTFLSLLDKSKLQRSYWNRIESIQNTYSAFTLYIIFKPETFPFLNHTGYYQDDYTMTWRHDEYTMETFPHGIMYITPPETMNDTWARKMIVNSIMTFDTVRQWENTTTGKRGKEYEDFKRNCEEAVLKKLEKVFPDVRSCIKSVYSATPLTIRDFYHQKEGSLYGFKKDCNNIIHSHLSARTKLGNLLLTGQNINWHGILGVSISSIITCAALTGMKELLDKINKHI